jgi:Calx-beta domain-containing protein
LFTVSFTNAVNALLANSRADVLILDDDPPPIVSVRDVSDWEGDSGTHPMVFEATLSAPSGNILSVRYATSNLTAVAGIDYVFALGLLTFQPGVTTQSFAVDIFGDTKIGPNRKFLVNLFNPTLVTLGANGIGTILDDDFRTTALSLTTAGMRFSFPSSPNARYRVEWTDNLSAPTTWRPLDGFQSLTASGATTDVLDPGAASDSQRFYRVLLLP